ncbi:hypothetical protein B0T26DRAFT_620629, partial [Lasiosphaeria miniovina]
DFENAKFTKPSDWDRWSEAYKKKAEHAGIYDFVNPNHRLRQPWPTEPKVPQFDGFQKKKQAQRRGNINNNTNRDDHNAPVMSRASGSNAHSVNRSAAQTRAASAAAAAATRRSQIEESNHNPDDGDHNDDDSTLEEEEDEEEENNIHNRATQFSDLSTMGQTNWKIAFELYKANLSVYNAKTGARSAFLNWVLKSIGPNYQHITKRRDLPEIYQAIKDQWLPFRKNITKGIRDDYTKHLAQIKGKDRKLSEWITRWQKLVNDGVEHEILQIATPSSWYEDLVEALKNIPDGKTWALGELATLEEDILE